MSPAIARSPWEPFYSEHARRWYIDTASGAQIDIRSTASAMSRDDLSAMVSLMAAAPDLLAALKTTAGNIRSLGPAGALPEPYTVWLRVVEDSIAKAEAQ